MGDGDEIKDAIKGESVQGDAIHSAFCMVPLLPLISERQIAHRGLEGW